jgi:hypothetical protein
VPTYQIRRIRSGFDEVSAWVSVWYRADPKRLDVLHIVVSGPWFRDRRLGPVYMERHDQSVACYGGVERIVVGDQGIEVRLNAKGARALALERALRLVAPEKLVGWKKARQVFRVIAGDPSDGVIRVTGK